MKMAFKFHFLMVLIFFEVFSVPSKGSAPELLVKKIPYTNHYFEFVGIRNSQEGDVTKWSEISRETYFLISSAGSHLGFRLITTKVQKIGGVARPLAVPLIPGTKDPTIGCGVIEVRNFQL